MQRSIFRYIAFSPLTGSSYGHGPSRSEAVAYAMPLCSDTETPVDTLQVLHFGANGGAVWESGMILADAQKLVVPEDGV